MPPAARTIRGLPVVITGGFLACSLALAGSAQQPRQPASFVVGRHFFLDVGPPNDFYEIFVVRPTPKGALIEKITLTPAADACLRPPTVEFVAARSPRSVASLLENKNPCALAKAQARGKPNRREQGPVFSFADVSMQVACHGQQATIRVKLLDRDLFGADPISSGARSWMMRLLNRLDAAAGPNALDRPIFSLAPLSAPAAPAAQRQADLGRELAAGRFDPLFAGDPEKPSDLDRAAAQAEPARALVRLLASKPARPRRAILPAYPLLAELAHVQGTVVATASISAAGAVSDLVVRGSPLLGRAAAQAVRAWKFPPASGDRKLQSTFQFTIHCYRPKSQAGR